MNLLLTFMDLDKLYEANQWLDRKTIVNKLKCLGKWHYKFDKYSDEQLYRMLERTQKEAEEEAAMQEYSDLLSVKDRVCSECSTSLTDGGLCPMCDDGEEYY